MATSIALGDAPSPILAALTKSRQALLFDALPLFSTKSRAKSAPQLTQPPHSIVSLPATTVSIGPHVFPRTKLFYVEWSQPTPVAPPRPVGTPSGQPAPPQAGAPPPPVAPRPTTSSAITPALIARLNAASAADPLLASILRKAAAGQANNQELAGLARYIEAMRREEELANAAPVPLPPAPIAPPPVVQAAPAKPPSIVIEFKESATERFVLPSHYSFTPLPNPPSAKPNLAKQSVALGFFVFPEKARDRGVPVPIELVFEDCNQNLRESLKRASRTGRQDKALDEWWKRTLLQVPLPVNVPVVAPPPPPPAPLAAIAAPPLKRQLSGSSREASATPVDRKRSRGGRASLARNTFTASASPEVSSPAHSSTGSAPKSRARPKAKPRSRAKPKPTAAASPAVVLQAPPPALPPQLG